MPSGKVHTSKKERSKDDTWKEAELAKYLQSDSGKVKRDRRKEGPGEDLRRSRGPAKEKSEKRGTSEDRRQKEEAKRQREGSVDRKREERSRRERSVDRKRDEGESVDRKRDERGKGRSTDPNPKREEKGHRERLGDRKRDERSLKGSVDRREKGRATDQKREEKGREKSVDKKRADKHEERRHREGSGGQRGKEKGTKGHSEGSAGKRKERRQQEEAGAESTIKKRDLIEKKIVTAQGNELGRLSPELASKEDDGIVKTRERKMLEQLAMEEHYEKMRHRQEDSDDEALFSPEEEKTKDKLLDEVVPPTAVFDKEDAPVGEDMYEEEEFDSYEDEFEEEEREEEEEGSQEEKLDLDDVMQAINKENRLHETGILKQNSSSSSSVALEPQKPVGKGFGLMTFDFEFARDKEIILKSAQKSYKRGRELLKLIELDVQAIEILDVAPQSEYELYIKRYGRGNTRQVCVQTNEDNMDEEVQTEPVMDLEKWTQHPPEDLHGFGGGREEVEEEEKAVQVKDSLRFAKFVQKAAHVVSVLLEESSSGLSRHRSDHRKSPYPFSSGCIRLASTASVFSGRRAVSCTFSPTQTNLLLTAFSASPSMDSQSDLFNGVGVVCLWNINDAMRPEKVLVCESLPLCCCFGPSKGSLAFAGTDDGSVVVWDLRESVSMHKVRQVGDIDWILRVPTYSSAGALSTDNHHSPICSVASIVSQQGDSEDKQSSFLSSQYGDASGLSYQIATLDESGVLNLWVVVELNKPDPAGSESDLGLVPGGRVKLVPSASIVIQTPTRLASCLPLHFRPFELDFSPDDPNHFYVATNLGCVLHGVRYGGRATPRMYKGFVDIAIDVRTVDVSPFSGSYFLAGCSDGSIRLHSVHREHPVLCWNDSTRGISVNRVRWSRSRPHVFYVLDEASTLYVWDLKTSDATPLISQKFEKKRILTFCLSNDHVALGIGLPGRQPEMVLCLSDGSVESHLLEEKLSVCHPNEVAEFVRYVESTS
eukprot:m.95335 g.95335  ORF g.95335 m.95335 type:complete len:994 (+) comp36846_c0_seq5:51-3032(+)